MTTRVKVGQRCWKDLLYQSLINNNESWKNIEELNIIVDPDFYGEQHPFINLEENFGGMDGTRTRDLLDQLTEEQLLALPFNDDWGVKCLIKLTAWTKDYIYFSRDYEGLDYIDVVERNPNSENLMDRRYSILNNLEAQEEYIKYILSRTNS
jgi:hypothetical protein